MKEIVFLEPNKIDAILFTTSKIVSEWTGVEHRKIKDAINKHKKPLETFGLLASYQAESMFGRPETYYNLNEQQATLIITFLKNTPVVVAFKTELVRQFYLMRSELMKRRDLREQLKPIRREMTDVIQEKEPDNIWAYKQYTDLAYKSATGKIARKLREERGAEKTANAIDYMTSEEINNIAKKENQIAVLLDMGMSYYQIKSLIFDRDMPQIVEAN